MELVGIRECARQMAARGLSIHPSTVSRQVTAGIIPNHGTPDAPLVNVDEAITARYANLDLTKRRRFTIVPPASPEPQIPAGELPLQRAAPEAANGGKTFNDARTERQIIEARLAQLSLEEKLGNLFDRSEVEGLFRDLGTALRDALLARGPALASRLAGRTSSADIQAIVEDEDRKLIERLTTEIAARMAAESQDAAA